jgi:hypothetical protein
MAAGNKPDFTVRAKVGDVWMTCGAAWHARNDTISLRLNTVPVGKDWDGSLLLVVPRDEEPR